MGFWIFMLIMNLLIPVTMIGFGRLFMYKAPGAINVVYGYRTSISMKNHLMLQKSDRLLRPITVFIRTLCSY